MKISSSALRVGKYLHERVAKPLLRRLCSCSLQYMGWQSWSVNIENGHSYGEMLSHCNVPSRGATGNFSKFASPRLVWKAVRRELQQGYFSMDRNIAWADCTASCRCSGLKGSSEKYILWKERSKLENNSFSAKKCIFGCSRASENYKSER